MPAWANQRLNIDRDPGIRSELRPRHTTTSGDSHDITLELDTNVSPRSTILPERLGRSIRMPTNRGSPDVDAVGNEHSGLDGVIARCPFETLGGRPATAPVESLFHSSTSVVGSMGRG